MSNIGELGIKLDYNRQFVIDENNKNNNNRASNTVLGCSEIIYQTYYYPTDNRGHPTRTRPTE
jgi:hypothetical protein